MNNDEIRRVARLIAENPELLNLGRFAVEKELIEMRDDRMSVLDRGNGLVIRERNGKESPIIRMGTEMALRTALLAIADGKTLDGIEREIQAHEAERAKRAAE